MINPRNHGGLCCDSRWELVVQRLAMDDGSYVKMGRRKMMVVVVDVQFF